MFFFNYKFVNQLQKYKEKEQIMEGLSQINKSSFQFKPMSHCQNQNPNINQHINSSYSNIDDEEFITQSPFRSSDPTMINRNKIISFQKTGELLKKMKRQLSTQALQKASQKGYNKINDKLSTQHSLIKNNSNQFSTINWQKIQRDQMTQAIMDQYQKQILRLKAQLDDIKEEKKQIKQTLQKQRRFYMSQMYSKQLILQQNDFQIDKLKGQIQKHINLHYQLQQKIRLLELENSEYKFQLQGLLNSQCQDQSQQMEPIYQENQYFTNSTAVTQNRGSSNKMCMSLDNGFSNHTFQIHQDPFDIMRLAHQKQILKYQKQIKTIKEFYQNKIKTLRKSITPQKGRPRNSINIMDQYVCPDNLSCESQTRPQNLRNMLREQFAYGKSGKKIDDTTSFATAHYFMYPQHSKKNLIGQDLLMRESQQDQLQIKCIDSEIKEQNNNENKFKSYLYKLAPSKQFIKGFSVGTLASGIIAFIAYKTINRE